MNDFSKDMKDILDNYATEVRKDVDSACLEVAKECSAKLKKTSPKRTGKYAKGWMVSEVATGGYGASTWVVHNKRYARLTHLLEKGHAKRSGGRVKAQPHIKPVEQWAIEELPKQIEKKLGD